MAAHDLDYDALVRLAALTARRAWALDESARCL